MANYMRRIDSDHPALIILLVDRSSSMNDGAPPKKESAARAVNGMIYEIINANDKGDRIADRAEIGVVGYGSQVAPLFKNTLSELDAKPVRRVLERRRLPGPKGMVETELEMPVWLEAEGSGGTPMAQAFERVTQVVASWCTAHRDHFPPVVINISDGEPDNMEAARAQAKELVKHSTNDGATLLFNVHLSTGGKNEVLLPATPKDLGSAYARFLFDISSELPPIFVKAAQDQHLPAAPGSRGCVFNASAETLIKVLNFGSSVVSEPQTV